MSPERTKNPLPCDIVRDLLPLYHDGVVSDTTGQAVEDHLEGCEPCRQEYADLCADLPEVSPETDSTGDQFVDTMKKAKRKRTLATLLAVVLTCGLLAGVLVFLDQVTFIPLPPEETQVAKVYRFEDNGETQFFLYCKNPVYTHYTSTRWRPSEEDPNTLVIHQNRTFWAKPYQEANEIRWTENIYLIDVAKEDGDYTTLMLNDQVIWTEEANGSDVPPEYVYIYATFYEDMEPFSSLFHDIDQNMIGVTYDDDHRLMWDLDGNLLADDYPDENGHYPPP